jgi:hypothetical protein
MLVGLACSFATNMSRPAERVVAFYALAIVQIAAMPAQIDL